MSSDPPPPAEWPKEVSACYSPVRIIGKGGFASVWMAKKKNNSNSDEEHVAIKVMKGDGYAKREIAILSELSTKYSHPNIVRLLQDHTKKEDVSSGSNCLVLSLARGPTLHFALNKYGGLGLIVAQSISRQLIDAVAFLHGHAVIHRDIQPCNVIVSGAQMNDDLWWSDTLDVDGKVSRLAKQCHITLVDFGFARALGPNDIKSDIGLKKILDESLTERASSSETEKAGMTGLAKAKLRGGAPCVDEALNDTPPTEEPRGRSRNRPDGILDASISHARIRDLSALGTRNYAAPEILSGIRNVIKSLNDSFHKKQGKTLGTCVSSYGMIADAFSVGSTIRHMVTGVPPSMNVEDYIASKNRPLKKLMKNLKSRIKKNDEKRAKKYRTSTDIPEEVNDLIYILTHYDSHKRATVRYATGHPWIKLPPTSPSKPKGSETRHGGPIVYLKCGEEEL